VLGEHAAAARGYLEQIIREPDGTEQWAGLALVTRELPAARSMAALLDHPDFVLAVHRALRATGEPPPSPWDLARWLTPDAVPAH